MPRARMLLVEDESSIVFALREFFAHAGYAIDCAAGPSEAQRLLDGQEYEAVITDLHLTTGQGCEGMAVAASARRQNPRACIVMLTAYGSPDVEREARCSGVDVFLAKPVELTHLRECLDRVRRGEPVCSAPAKANRW